MSTKRREWHVMSGCFTHGCVETHNHHKKFPKAVEEVHAVFRAMESSNSLHWRRCRGGMIEVYDALAQIDPHWIEADDSYEKEWEESAKHSPCERVLWLDSWTEKDGRLIVPYGTFVALSALVRGDVKGLGKVLRHKKTMEAML